MQVIQLKSRYEVYGIPLDKLPDEPFAVTGEDGWFMTNKEHIINYNKIADWIEHKLMYGNKR